MNFLKYFATFTSGSLSYFLIKTLYNKFVTEDTSNSPMKSELLKKITQEDNSIEFKEVSN